MIVKLYKVKIRNKKESIKEDEFLESTFEK